MKENQDAFLDAKLHLAFIYERQNRLDDAAAALKEAIDLKGVDVELYRILASLYRNAGRTKEAIDTLVEALLLEPENESVHFMLGVMYDEIGMWKECIAHMTRAADINPRNANALNYIGYTLAEREIELDSAEDYIKKALAIEPESGHIIDSLGWVYYKKGEFEKAVTELERATGYLPEDAVIVEHLGDAYLKKSDRQKAREAYEKAYRLAPDNESLKAKIENYFGVSGKLHTKKSDKMSIETFLHRYLLIASQSQCKRF